MTEALSALVSVSAFGGSTVYVYMYVYMLCIDYVILCVCFDDQSCVVQLGPKECLLMSGDCHGDAGRLRQMLSQCGILITDRKKSEQFFVVVLFILGEGEKSCIKYLCEVKDNQCWS